MNKPSTSPPALTVSQLNRKARQLLEMHFNQVWVEGELSNLATPSSGHWYFTLKDVKSQVRCAYFRNERQKLYNRQQAFTPKEGLLVRIRARVSIYEGRGDYQLIVETLEDAGVGALQRDFEKLKQKISDEGLFNPEFKQELPTYPQHIGVITSPTGAAIHDVLTVLERRYPLASITVLPVAVQGKEAAVQIASAIQKVNSDSFTDDFQKLDVLIVGRGGGSLEDLWAFNEEIVARAIFASEIPIVSAVGHEVDFSIADFVADVRAATPSAAAELISPDSAELLSAFNQLQQRFFQLFQGFYKDCLQQVKLLSSQLRHPGQALQEQAQHLDHLDVRLQKSLSASQQNNQQKYQSLFVRLQKQAPTESIRWSQLKLNQSHKNLLESIQQQQNEKQQKLASLSQFLHGLSPLNTLNRGYAIVKDQKGKIIQDSKQIKIGAKITTQLKQGGLVCEVLSLE